MKLRIGEIPYLNLVPIFNMLRQECDCTQYDFVKGHPAELNEMLRKGALDVSPSSSIEYLRKEGDYSVIEGHSISSRGPVESILLFSRLPLKDLGGREVFVTHHSETSAALLAVVLKKFHNIDCDLKVSGLPSDEALKSHSAFLAIGDEALKAARVATNITEECPETGCSFLRFGIFQYFVYDLGEIWQEHTGLPFVYALWIARNDLSDAKKALLEKFSRDLDRAKERALEKLPELARLLRHDMSPDKAVEYWRHISYDYESAHKEGLALFKRYLDELDLLSSS
jgi:chorismate dehydratase